MDNKKEMSMGKKAKMDNLHALRKMAMDMIREHSDMPEEGGMSKVMVAAKDREGLEKGLDKAKEVLQNSDESKNFNDAEDDLDDDYEKEAMASSEDASDEDLQAQLEALKAKIEAKKQRK